MDPVRPRSQLKRPGGSRREDHGVGVEGASHVRLDATIEGRRGSEDAVRERRAGAILETAGLGVWNGFLRPRGKRAEHAGEQEPNHDAEEDHGHLGNRSVEPRSTATGARSSGQDGPDGSDRHDGHHRLIVTVSALAASASSRAPTRRR